MTSRLVRRGRPLPSARRFGFGNNGSIIDHCMSDSSSRFAMYEKYMTFLQSTSHFFIFEIASTLFKKTAVSGGKVRLSENSLAWAGMDSARISPALPTLLP